MQEDHIFLLSLAAIFLCGQAISVLGKKTALPRVTLLLIFGVIIGRGGLDLVPQLFAMQFELVAKITLMMIGFLIGGKLTVSTLNKNLKSIFYISFFESFCAAAFVCLGLWLFSIPLPIAIIIGCIASASAPAAIWDVVLESSYKSNFVDLLLSIVALDDAWALILFGIGLALALALSGNGQDVSSVYHVIKDIGGAIVLGLMIGLPAAFLTGRLKPGEPMLTEALGLVFLCGGLAIYFDVSFLVASIVMGAVIANLASHHDYPFHAIENIEWPFMVIFFVLAGATIDIEMMKTVGMVGAIYMLCRVAGKLLGVHLGGWLSGYNKKQRTWLGVALMPQAGVSIGMGLIAANSFPESRQFILSLVIGSTMLFELAGPVLTRVAIQKVQQQEINL